MTLVCFYQWIGLREHFNRKPPYISWENRWFPKIRPPPQGLEKVKNLERPKARRIIFQTAQRLAQSCKNQDKVIRPLGVVSFENGWIWMDLKNPHGD